MRDRLALIFISMGKWLSVCAILLFILSLNTFEDIGLFSNINLMIEDHFHNDDEFIIYPVMMITILILTLIGDLSALAGSILSDRYRGIKKVFIVASIPVSLFIPFILAYGIGFISYALPMVISILFFPLLYLSIVIAMSYSIHIRNLLVDIPENVRKNRKRIFKIFNP